MIFLGGEVEVVDGYVFVCNESVPDELRARTILAAVDDALAQSGSRGVLFDTRDMPAPTEAVNTILRTWVDAGRLHDKVALLVRSDLKRIASNMRAISVGVKMRSFHELAEAEAWLLEPLPQAPAKAQEQPTPAPASDGPACRWRSPLLRGVVGSGNDK
ncbi:STAS/SEC14 domain-containing protein [Enhygromyxa salina]|uniref:STAS/SEC14 domain-containing protein n=1 Tax=Enhygromyxa salina TaxID=215803 RepID=UPI0011B215FF|nr:STAS/SEC14 domain-containing protein [Enhygromyxa salina]